MAKTIAFGQDPPLYKKSGGLFIYLLPPPKKDGVLLEQPPSYQDYKLRKRFEVSCAVLLAMQASCTWNI